MTTQHAPLGHMAYILRLEAQRDELLAALQRIVDGDLMLSHADTVIAYETIARNAIAKAVQPC